jgi:microcystin-dependent protein
MTAAAPDRWVAPNYSSLTGSDATVLQQTFQSLSKYLQKITNSVVLSNARVTSSSPIGSVIAYAGSAAPSGWLLCDGGSTGVLRTTYSALFAIIGTTYGAGDGSTTFNVPDLRGRVVAGVDNMGSVDAGRLSIANTLGTSTGTETVTLATADIPAHSHANTLTNNAVTSGNQSADHSHTFSTGGISANHTHTWGYSLLYYAAGGSLTAAANGSTNNLNTGTVSSDHSHSGTTAGMNVSHNHSVTSNVTISNVNAGGGGAHSNMQPTMVLNYIIYTGV